MKSSKRDLLLVPGSGRINLKRRYYNLRSALRHCMEDVIANKVPMVIHDTSRGVDIATVRPTIGQVRVYIDSPRRFTRLWSR